MIWRWLILAALSAAVSGISAEFDPLFDCKQLGMLAPGTTVPDSSPLRNSPTKLTFEKKTMAVKYFGIDPGKGVAYLGPAMVDTCRVTVHDGKLYDEKGVLLQRGPDTIFVMDMEGSLLVYNPRSLSSLLIQHSSFTSGRGIAAAGRIEVVDGVIVKTDAKSGHYHPEKRHFLQLQARLAELGYDLPLSRMHMHYDKPALSEE